MPIFCLRNIFNPKNGVKASGSGEMTSYVEVHGWCYMIEIAGVALFKKTHRVKLGKFFFFFFWQHRSLVFLTYH